MYLREILFVCLCLFSWKVTEAKELDEPRESNDILNRMVQLFSDGLLDKDKASTEEVQRSPDIPDDLEELTAEKEDDEQFISPVAKYILTRMMQGSQNQGFPPKFARGNEELRNARADHVIGINSRENTLPWDDECSGGYKHCGGYFPLCCEGFVCLKPLTPWDIKYGFKRCWPHYFQDEEEQEQGEN